MERMVACGSNEMEQNDTEDAVQPETEKIPPNKKHI